MSKRTITTHLGDGRTHTMKSGAKTVYTHAVIAQLNVELARQELAEHQQRAAQGAFDSYTQAARLRAERYYTDRAADAEAGHWLVVSHHGSAAAAAKGLAEAQTYSHLAAVRVVETEVVEG